MERRKKPEETHLPVLCNDRRTILSGLSGTGLVLLTGCTDLNALIGTDEGNGDANGDTNEAVDGNGSTADDAADETIPEATVVDTAGTVVQGEAVTVDVEIENNGQSADELGLELNVDGVVADEWVGRVDAGGTRTITLTIDGGETGTLEPATHNALVISYYDGADVAHETAEFTIDEAVATADIVEFPDELTQGQESQIVVEITNDHPVENVFSLFLTVSDEEVDDWSGSIEAFETQSVSLEVSGSHTVALETGSHHVDVSLHDQEGSRVDRESVVDSATVEIVEPWLDVEIVDMPDSMRYGESVDVEFEVEISEPRRTVGYYLLIYPDGTSNFDSGVRVDHIEGTPSAGRETETLTIDASEYEQIDAFSARDTYWVGVWVTDGTVGEDDVDNQTILLDYQAIQSL